MTPDRKKPGVAFWAAVAVPLILAGYVLSIGPAFWLSARCAPGPALEIEDMYKPMFTIAESGAIAKSVIVWYIKLGGTGAELDDFNGLHWQRW